MKRECDFAISDEAARIYTFKEKPPGNSVEVTRGEQRYAFSKVNWSLEKGGELAFEDVSVIAKAIEDKDKKLEEVADLLEVFPVQYQEAARKHPKVGSDGKSILSASVPFLLPAALVQRSLDALCKTDPMALPNQSD
ncbi:hypothetical protein PI125_g4316 [Phytophthora idaei]|nr:hypothetical protein PI125_g4316 [Phytophthora idaei]KAG3166683.1 hypothetical protein PI126_g4114 [Phytophthora idaei]